MLEIPKETLIAFPDAGSAKRFSESFPEHEKIICDKIRD
jgi:hypothetical protein